MAPGPVRRKPTALEKKFEAIYKYLDARDGKKDRRFFGLALLTNPSKIINGTPIVPPKTTLAACYAAELKKSVGQRVPPLRIKTAGGKIVPLNCKKVAQTLEGLIAADKKLPVARFVEKWRKTAGLKPDARRIKRRSLKKPTKEEFYADQLIRAMIGGILATVLLPGLSFLKMIGALDNRFPTLVPKLCIAVRRDASTFGIPALKTLVVTTGAEAKKLFKAVQAKHSIPASP
jgi:hypothetical protein